MLIQTLYLSVIAFLVSIVLYFIGNTFINISFKAPIFKLRNVFLSIFWGSLLIVSITAIFQTDFSSVFLLAIIPVSFLIHQKQKIELVEWVEWKWQIISIPILHFAISILMQLLPYSSNMDIPFYSKISEYLITNNIENNFHYFNSEITNSVGNNIYHYFDLWFNGIVGVLVSSKFSYMLVMKSFTIPLFSSFIILGFCDFFRETKFHKQTYSITVILILVLLLISWSSIINIGNPAWPIIHSIFQRSIFVFHYFGLLAAFLMYYKSKNISHFIGYLMLLPITSAATAPAIFVGSILFLFYMFFIKKDISKHDFYVNVGFVITLAFIFFIFYRFTGISPESKITSGTGFYDIISYNFVIWKAIVHQTISLSLRTLLLASIPIIILIVHRKKINNAFTDIVVFSIILTIAGILIFQSISTIDNSYQIPFIGYASIALLITSSIHYIFNLSNKYWKAIAFFGFLILAVQNNYSRVLPFSLSETIEDNFLKQRGYSQHNIQSVKSLLAKPAKGKIKAGFYISSINKTGFQGYLNKPIVWQYGQDFYILNNELELYPITPPQNIRKAEVLESLNKVLPFYDNYDRNNETNYINQYIKENDLQFVFSDTQIEGLNVEVIVFE